MTGSGPANPWLAGDVERGARYDGRFARLAASGHHVHAEADLVASLGPSSVLDAGCGTGRVAIELARRGIDVVGVDLDDEMLGQARAKAPDLTWVASDLASLALPRSFDAAVLAGNVMIFVTPGTEGDVLAGIARHLRPGGLLVAGFSLLPGRLGLATYDSLARHAGFELLDRWSTWERAAPIEGGDYAVSLHCRDMPGLP